MKYTAEIISHITVDASTPEQAECQVNNLLSKMTSTIGGDVIKFTIDHINKKHCRHTPHYFQSSTYGKLRHQHINISRLKPGSMFAYWNKRTDLMYLYEQSFSGTWGTWIIECWVKSGLSYIISKTTGLDNDTILQRIEASNRHDPNAEGYVIGMEHIASRPYILYHHPNALLIGYNTKGVVTDN